VRYSASNAPGRRPIPPGLAGRPGRLQDPRARREDPGDSEGKPIGFKVDAIRPSSILASLGVQNGDTILSVNGMALDSTENVLAVYGKIEATDRWSVRILRRGTEQTLEIQAIP